ncbi:conserved hypothetical protein [Ricinus communis]|uniref:Uncharacterized protein n=1 Tax=Ricinus communis TaxID=3988 RepID=B9RWX8_RICCO|nr:conserved hypothetical protein [Ricinus communis]
MPENKRIKFVTGSKAAGKAAMTPNVPTIQVPSYAMPTTSIQGTTGGRGGKTAIVGREGR